MKKTGTVFSAIVIVMITSLGAAGAVQDFYDEADFLAAVAFPLDMESFENLPADNGSALSHLFLPDFTLEASSPTLGVWDYTPSWGGHPTDGDQYVLIGSTSFQLSFYLNSSVKAFGINIIDWGDWGSGTLSGSLNGQGIFNIAIGPLPQDNELFFGAISTQAFDTVTLSHNISGEAYMIDEVYYTPEPATVCLLGLGGLLLRRRKSL